MGGHVAPGPRAGGLGRVDCSIYRGEDRLRERLRLRADRGSLHERLRPPRRRRGAPREARSLPRGTVSLPRVVGSRCGRRPVAQARLPEGRPTVRRGRLPRFSRGLELRGPPRLRELARVGPARPRLGRAFELRHRASEVRGRHLELGASDRRLGGEDSREGEGRRSSQDHQRVGLRGPHERSVEGFLGRLLLRPSDDEEAFGPRAPRLPDAHLRRGCRRWALRQSRS